MFASRVRTICGSCLISAVGLEPLLYVDLMLSVLTGADGGSQVLRPMGQPGLGLVGSAVGQQVNTATIDNGALCIALSDGSEIRCEPHQSLEAWQVVGGTPEHFIVCLPGGKIAAWAD